MTLFEFWTNVHISMNRLHFIHNMDVNSFIPPMKEVQCHSLQADGPSHGHGSVVKLQAFQIVRVRVINTLRRCRNSFIAALLSLQLSAVDRHGREPRLDFGVDCGAGRLHIHLFSSSGLHPYVSLSASLAYLYVSRTVVGRLKKNLYLFTFKRFWEFWEMKLACTETWRIGVDLHVAGTNKSVSANATVKVLNALPTRNSLPPFPRNLCQPWNWVTKFSWHFFEG